MTQADVKIATAEAKRFLERAKVVLEVYRGAETTLVPSKHTAALRRASLDLTRALAAMRSPQ